MTQQDPREALGNLVARLNRLVTDMLLDPEEAWAILIRHFTATPKPITFGVVTAYQTAPSRFALELADLNERLTGLESGKADGVVIAQWRHETNEAIGHLAKVWGEHETRLNALRSEDVPGSRVLVSVNSGPPTELDSALSTANRRVGTIKDYLDLWFDWATRVAHDNDQENPPAPPW